MNTEKMASMAARFNATLDLTRHIFKAEKNDGIDVATQMGFYPSRDRATMTRNHRRFSVTASSSGNLRSHVDIINGKKVNGVHVEEAGSLLGNKNSGAEVVKDRGSDASLHSCLHGKFVEDKFVYRQTFVIRSYEIGPDKTATMETLMNLLQVYVWLFSYLFFDHIYRKHYVMKYMVSFNCKNQRGNCRRRLSIM